MKKTTITFTALPQRAAAGADGKLQLSVFIAPRLWTTEPAEQKQILLLKDYPRLRGCDQTGRTRSATYIST